jgi:hypothetical protein
MFERKISRKIFGPTKEDNGTCRIKTNNELAELIKHQNIINYVKAQRLSWFGHINRVPESRIVKKIYKWKPFTSRPVARPKSGWEVGVRNDLRQKKTYKMDRRSPRSPHIEGYLLRKPRLYQSCSEEEEEVVEEEEEEEEVEGEEMEQECSISGTRNLQMLQSAILFVGAITQNCEKRLLPSSCLSVRIILSQDGFS